ncbi:unnamed protein product [Rotaria sordida]|uniref:C2H2-type domain-containing protein n=1 Tax=Rotaria sordida TaxID=392033 RepID=A0A815QCP4_9BILA|nr:unnamed protein product [Rotaria sordida]
MSNRPHSQNQDNKNNRPFRCSKCTLTFSHQRAYHEHLRNHTITHKTNVHNATSDTSISDDTARYIAERRKNYPTTDNINKKMKSDEERQERGDVLETRQFGRIKERKTNSNKNNETELTIPIITTSMVNSTNTSATLLERLLAPDIRRERNMVLQCIRHIVNNNFYGLDDN